MRLKFAGGCLVFTFSMAALNSRASLESENTCACWQTNTKRSQKHSYTVHARNKRAGCKENSPR